MKVAILLCTALLGAAVSCAADPNAAPVAQFVSPAPGALLDAPAATVGVRAPEGASVRLWVNGQALQNLHAGRTETDPQTHQVTQTWYGLTLRPGPNTLSAQAVMNNASGPAVTLPVQVRGMAEKLVLTPRALSLPADGRATVTILGRLLDRWGNTSAGEATVFLDAGGGRWLGTNADPSQPGFHVLARGGQFVAILQSGTHAGAVTIRSQVGAMQAETHVEFLTDLRPSLLAGVVNVQFGKGSVDYDRPVQDFLSRDGASDRSDLRVSSSGFGTGTVGGARVSGGYNSDHALNQTASGADSLGRDTQTADQTYQVFGDSSEAEAQAQSRDRLFLRAERDNNYALWGDYGTDEFSGRSQQFTAISRAFHAFKANGESGPVQGTLFYGDNVQGFQRDTIGADGTSGYYFLSHRPLVYGSENVTVELDDLTRPGVPVSVTNAQRGTDYEIDYDRGAVLFHQPLQRTDVGLDGRVLTRRVVVTYQYETGTGGTGVFGGRLQFHGQGGSLLGTTFVRQNQGLRSFNLYGADTLVPIGHGGTLVAEAARSQNGSETLGPVSGSAYRVEAAGALGTVQGRAYVRSVGTGFANDATTSFTPGQTRAGAQAAAALGKKTHLRAQIDRETNRGTAPAIPDTADGLLQVGTTALPGARVDNSLTTLSAGAEQQVGRADVSADLISRHRTDNINPQTLNGDSRQVQTRVSLPLPPRLSLLVQNDTTLSAHTDAIEPDRTLVGLAYAVSPSVSVRLNQQYFGRGSLSGRSATSLETLVQRPWGDGDFSERVSITGGANAFALQQALELSRRWAVAPGLHLSAGYERLSGTLLGGTAAGPQGSQTYAPGQSAASLAVTGATSETVGLDYTRPRDFKASARVEDRTSSGGRSIVVTGAAAGKVNAALTSLLTYQQAQASNPGLESLGRSVTLRLGLAYRDPASDVWNALLRYEFRRNPATTPNTLLVGSGTGSRDHTFAAEVIYAPEWQWEWYAKVARRDTSSYFASDYAASSRIDLAQGRLTYRFRRNMDILGEARWVGEPAAGYGSRGTHLEMGYYVSPELRLSGGYSFGRVQDPDFNGSLWAGGWTLGLTAKVDQLFGGFGVQRAAFDPPQEGKAAKPDTAGIVTGGRD